MVCYFEQSKKYCEQSKKMCERSKEASWKSWPLVRVKRKTLNRYKPWLITLDFVTAFLSLFSNFQVYSTLPSGRFLKGFLFLFFVLWRGGETPTHFGLDWTAGLGLEFQKALSLWKFCLGRGFNMIQGVSKKCSHFVLC